MIVQQNRDSNKLKGTKGFLKTKLILSPRTTNKKHTGKRERESEKERKKERKRERKKEREIERERENIKKPG